MRSNMDWRNVWPAAAMLLALVFGSASGIAQESENLDKLIDDIRMSTVHDRGWDVAKLPGFISEVQNAIENEPDAANMGPAYLLLGELLRASGQDDAAIEVYAQALELPLTQTERMSSLRGQRESYARFGRQEDAFRVAELLIEEYEKAIEAGNDRESVLSGYWYSDVRWIADHYERSGDLLSAVRVQADITNRYQGPQFRWSGLQHEARLLRRAGELEKAYERYAEAYHCLKQVPDLPQDVRFLATEVELLRNGTYRGEKTREYLMDLADILERYREACGYCTLGFEHGLAMSTLHLPDADETDQFYAIGVMSSMIERAEEAERLGIQRVPGFDETVLRSGYLTVISTTTHELRDYVCCDSEFLNLLKSYLHRFAEDPDTPGYVGRRLKFIEDYVDPSLWTRYPELDVLRRQVEDTGQRHPDRAEGIPETPVGSSTPTNSDESKGYEGEQIDEPEQATGHEASAEPKTMPPSMEVARFTHGHKGPTTPAPQNEVPAVGRTEAGVNASTLSDKSVAPSHSDLGVQSNASAEAPPQPTGQARDRIEPNEPQLSDLQRESIRTRMGVQGTIVERENPAVPRRPTSRSDPSADRASPRSAIWPYAGGAALLAAIIGAMLLWRAKTP